MTFTNPEVLPGKKLVYNPYQIDTLSILFQCSVALLFKSQTVCYHLFRRVFNDFFYFIIIVYSISSHITYIHEMTRQNFSSVLRNWGVTRRLIRLQNMCNVLKYRKILQNGWVRLRFGCDYFFNLLKFSRIRISTEISIYRSNIQPKG